MAFSADKIWMNGEFVDWDKAKIHVLSHVVHYGSGIFEGIRSYQCQGGKSAVFRLPEHVERLFDSAKVYRMEIPFSQKEIHDAILLTLKENKLPSAYIRPLAYRGFGQLGLNPQNSPVEVIIAAWQWGSYLGEKGLKEGIAACVSSWHRPAPNTHPALSKASGNYLNSQLIKMEALSNNYDEGIALDTDGWIAEGSGENLFVINKGTVFTVPIGSAILPGITRSSIIEIARNEGLVVEERRIAREFLYLADEIFMTGTAAEVTPIASVDKIKVGNGGRGPITKLLQEKFFSSCKGAEKKYQHWLTYV